MLRALATYIHRLRRGPMTVCLILGLLLGVNTSLITGEGLIEEITLGTLGGPIGGALYRLVGGTLGGLKFLVLSALVGAHVGAKRVGRQDQSGKCQRGNRPNPCHRCSSMGAGADCPLASSSATSSSIGAQTSVSVAKPARS